jgi:hypothetical protein
MKETVSTHNKLIVSGIAFGSLAALAALGSFLQREIQRRGYPSWGICRCDFKHKQAFHQVWYSRHERRGETIVIEERGPYLAHPAQWLRRLLHHSAQILAVLNPGGRYVERITLSPQETRTFAAMLYTASSGEALDEETTQKEGQIAWRREILHVPNHFFDAYLRRLYPVHLSQERQEQAAPLPVLWDPHNDLPLPSEGPLLETPNGTRIDYIGWTPSQISYCTARLTPRT